MIINKNINAQCVVNKQWTKTKEQQVVHNVITTGVQIVLQQNFVIKNINLISISKIIKALIKFLINVLFVIRLKYSNVVFGVVCILIADNLNVPIAMDYQKKQGCKRWKIRKRIEEKGFSMLRRIYYKGKKETGKFQVQKNKKRINVVKEKFNSNLTAHRMDQKLTQFLIF